jgi:hypothetical protein
VRPFRFIDLNPAGPPLWYGDLTLVGPVIPIAQFMIVITIIKRRSGPGWLADL